RLVVAVPLLRPNGAGRDQRDSKPEAARAHPPVDVAARCGVRAGRRVARRRGGRVASGPDGAGRGAEDGGLMAALYALQGVQRVFRSGAGEVRAVDGIDLEIEAGEFIAIE